MKINENEKDNLNNNKKQRHCFKTETFCNRNYKLRNFKLLIQALNLDQLSEAGLEICHVIPKILTNSS